MTLTVVILTINETLHICRAIESIDRVADQILVLDSGASHGTVAIDEHPGVRVIRHLWCDDATQFNFALDYLPEAAD